MAWLIVITQLLIAFAALAWSAHKFVDSSASFAQHWGLSPLIIGVVVVGFGTSFPEMVVSALAAVHGNPQLAIGNVIGSNIANKTLVGGFCALIAPLVVNRNIIKRELPILMLLSLIVAALLYRGSLTRWDGVILLLLFCAYMFWSFYQHSHTKNDPLDKEVQQHITPGAFSLWRNISWWIFSLLVLLGSSQLVVYSAVNIAKMLGISDLVIGLTIVAVGTSLPEMASTIVCSLRKDYDIALGNIVGSSVFNLLPVLAMPALIAPTKIPDSVIYRDYPAMLIAFLLFWLLASLPGKKNGINRVSGSVLFAGYVMYLLILTGVVVCCVH